MRVGVGTHDVNDNGVIDGTESPRIGVGGMTTSELQAPTDYEGIYETWNVDLNPPFIGEGEADDPWDFGTATQYPVLSRDLNGVGGATWQEFGYQIRAGLTLTASTADGQARVNLSWTAADLSCMDPGAGHYLYRHPRQRHYRPDHRRGPDRHRVQRYGCDGRQALHLPGDGGGRRRGGGAAVRRWR